MDRDENLILVFFVFFGPVSVWALNPLNENVLIIAVVLVVESLARVDVGRA